MVLGKEPTRTRGGAFALRDDAASEQIALSHLLQLNIALEDYNRPVGSLSGGQRQSVAIARVVTDDVVMVILDEPTAALGCFANAECAQFDPHVGRAECGCGDDYARH